MAAVQELPESFSVEDLLERVILLEKTKRGMEQSRAGQVVDMAQAKGQLKKWLQ